MKITLIEAIELGLNILAQDLIKKKHTQREIDNYINQFKFVRRRNVRAKS
jgi:hypothetical protein